VAGHDTWVRQVLTAFERFRVLCAVRDGDWGVAGLNKAIETDLTRNDWLPRNRGEWYTGRPVR
jgi:exodeoxyribonuclease V alpha subunit